MSRTPVVRRARHLLSLSLAVAWLVAMGIQVVAAGPVIALSPTSGQRGSTFQINGSGYKPGELIQAVRWDQTPLPTQPSYPMADSYGNFTATATVPSDAPQGAHKVSALSQSGAATAQFTVSQPAPTPTPTRVSTPAATPAPTPAPTPVSLQPSQVQQFDVTPMSGPPGTPVRLLLQIATPNGGQAIRFALDGNPVSDPLPIPADGRLELAVPIPSGLSAGPHIFAVMTTDNPPRVLRQTSFQVVIAPAPSTRATPTRPPGAGGFPWGLAVVVAILLVAVLAALAWISRGKRGTAASIRGAGAGAGPTPSPPPTPTPPPIVVVAGGTAVAGGGVATTPGPGPTPTVWPGRGPTPTAPPRPVVAPGEGSGGGQVPGGEQAPVPPIFPGDPHSPGIAIDLSQPPPRPTVRCPTCDGGGGVKGQGTCSGCAGSGACTSCHGTGHCDQCGGTLRKKCDGCHGSGHVSSYLQGGEITCPTCGGSGSQDCFSCGYPYNQRGPAGTCSVCGGSGRCGACGGDGHSRDRCPTCGGSGRVPAPPPPPLTESQRDQFQRRIRDWQKTFHEQHGRPPTEQEEQEAADRIDGEVRKDVQPTPYDNP